MTNESAAMALVRRIAEESAPLVDGDYGSYCFYCARVAHLPHEDDCKWAEACRIVGLPVPATVGPR